MNSYFIVTVRTHIQNVINASPTEAKLLLKDYHNSVRTVIVIFKQEIHRIIFISKGAGARFSKNLTTNL